MTAVGIRELSHQTSRYIAKVRAGETIEITDRGHIIATIVPVAAMRHWPKPRIGGYRSTAPLTAEQIDAELAAGFGTDDRR